MKRYVNHLIGLPKIHYRVKKYLTVIILIGAIYYLSLVSIFSLTLWSCSDSYRELKSKHWISNNNLLGLTKEELVNKLGTPNKELNSHFEYDINQGFFELPMSKQLFIISFVNDSVYKCQLILKE